MSQGELHQVIFEEAPNLFTGTFLQCIDESRRRGVVKGLRIAADYDEAISNHFMNPIKMIRSESAKNHRDEAFRLEHELAATPCSNNTANSEARGVLKGLIQAQQILAAYTNPEVLLKQEIDRLQQNLPQSKL